jgi:adenylate cyclase
MVSLLDKINENCGIGIAINTGEAIIGNIGSPKHTEYSIIGDTLNTAIQLQNLSHDSPKGVLITQSTYDEIKDYFECETLGPKTMQGKDEAVNIYKVIKRVAPK